MLSLSVFPVHPTDTVNAEPAEKKRRQQLSYLESEEFQEILNARSKHTSVLKEVNASYIKENTQLV